MLKPAQTLALLWFLCVSAAAQAGDSPPERATLKGVKQMRVTVDVETRFPKASAAGLTDAQFRTEIEGRLRQSGIGLDPRAPQMLYVRVGLVENEGRYGYHVTLSFEQLVTVARTKEPAVASTWSVSALGMAPETTLSETVRRSVRSRLDAFITAYQSVNPKP